MKLGMIMIKNFRSIDNLMFYVDEIDGSYTFALIGVNESGKSNFLEAIALVGNNSGELSQKDYFDKKEEVRITLVYDLNEEERDKLHKEIITRFNATDLPSHINRPAEVHISAVFDPIEKAGKTMRQRLAAEVPQQEVIFNSGVIATKKKTGHGKVDEGSEYKSVYIQNFERGVLLRLFGPKRFPIWFWKPSKECLIDEAINLDEFANDPTISIPLSNCLKLVELNPEDMRGLDHTEERNITGVLEDGLTK